MSGRKTVARGDLAPRPGRTTSDPESQSPAASTHENANGSRSWQTMATECPPATSAAHSSAL